MRDYRMELYWLALDRLSNILMGDDLKVEAEITALATQVWEDQRTDCCEHVRVYARANRSRET